jgi:hypothetical protein
MTKQTTITIEAKSLLVLHSRNSRSAWCPMCGAQVEVVALENTGVISNLEQRVLEDWLNSGELHRFEGPDDSVLICLNSLLARVQNTKPANCGIPRLPNTEKERT